MTKRTPSATATHGRPHVTKRAKFLAQMDAIVPWNRLCAIVAKRYPKAGNGRPPLGLELMLRVYFLQHWFNLSDPAVEDMLYDSASMRTFAGVDPEKRRAPDETTVCKFRHLLERHRLGKRLFGAINAHLRSRGIRVGNGTIVDATIVHAPSSTKNADGARDPEMHQTKKGNQWYFGMKLHAGVDSATKIVHRFSGSVGVVTPFRAQANRIRDLVTERLDLTAMDRSDLVVDTAHGFQGDERDVILFSPCVGVDMPRGAKYFLASTGNLFNVAITRARTLLHVIGDRSACASCGIKHIEDFAKYVASLEGNTERGNGTTSWDDASVGPWERPFHDALAAAGIRTMPQYKVNQYRLDLAIVGEDSKRIDLEVDGEYFHRDWDGSRCREDVLRDMRLSSLGWRVKRFWVYQLREGMDECVREVIDIVGDS